MSSLFSSFALLVACSVLVNFFQKRSLVALVGTEKKRLDEVVDYADDRASMLLVVLSLAILFYVPDLLTTWEKVESSWIIWAGFIAIRSVITFRILWKSELPFSFWKKYVLVELLGVLLFTGCIFLVQQIYFPES